MNFLLAVYRSPRILVPLAGRRGAGGEVKHRKLGKHTFV